MEPASAHPSAPLVGHVLGGRFEILALLGQGGMGAVYRARDRELDEVVALKVIRPELARHAEMVQRFRQEVKLARRVTHRNVARIYELGNLDGTAFFTMELIDGRPLSARMRAEGRLPWREAVAIAAGILDGLDAAHAVGVIHRDIKPDNLLLDRGGRVVVTDFGIASARAAEPGLVAGTPVYMAPETVADEPPTPAVDVYAVGVVLYEMLSGASAFTGTPDQILADKRARDHLELTVPGLERALVDVVARATAFDVARRVRTAHELRGLLAPWVEGAPPPPRAARRRTDSEIKDVVVLTTIERSHPARYLADAVYLQVVSHLWQTARLRVVPAWHADALTRACASVVIELGDVVTVRAHDAGGRELVVARLPLEAPQVEAGGRAVAHAVVAAFGLGDDDLPGARPAAVVDLILRARELSARLSSNAVAEATRLYDEAAALAPRDPAIAAGRAMVLARNLAHVSAADEAEHLALAARAADAALKRSPELAEAQIAAGHVTLHRGEPVAAAQHMRRAIAAAPHLAEAHEWLGRMLLEAGYLDEGMARLETALALDPRLELVRWEIARAHALEGRWDEYERLARELIGPARMRVTPWTARFALWRGDRDTMAAMIATMERGEMSENAGRGFIAALAGVFRDGWAAHRDRIRALALHGAGASARRQSLLCQLVAESAGNADDDDTVRVAVERALELGFYDLHWLDRCPVLDGARAAGVLARFRPRVVARAEAILDALYGDRPSSHATADTAIATVEGRTWDATIDEAS
ncbi:MAG TPA: protein kinase [Kofleriaceae bacterium]|nr:protein kinase [Kofleriaceae bacterium]